MTTRTDSDGTVLVPLENAYFGFLQYMNSAMFDRRSDGSENNNLDLNTWGDYNRYQTVNVANAHYVQMPQYKPFPSSITNKLSDMHIGMTDYMKIETGKFIVGDRPCTQAEFDRFKADLTRMGAPEYLMLYKERYIKPN